MPRKSSQARPKPLVVDVNDCRIRLHTGEPVVFVDARRTDHWEAAEQKISEAVRLGPGDGPAYLACPKRCYIVVYCA